MKKRSNLISLLVISMFILGTSAIKQGNPDNNSGISSFDEGWRISTFAVQILRIHGYERPVPVKAGQEQGSP